MSTAPSSAPTDTRNMGVIHSLYRRELRLAAGLVRTVPDGDRARARVVADHLAWVGEHLHRHHTLEDRMLWPLLLERVPEELAPIVQLMEAQHATVDHVQDAIAELLPRWRESAGREVGEQLASHHDRLYVHLVEHLDAEEQRLLPIAAQALSQEEWDAIGDVARAETPRAERMLTFGSYVHGGDPAAVASMLAQAPAPVRALLPRLALRAFRRHARRVHGTPTP